MGAKWFKGTKTFNSYKELCEYLGIEPARRGAEREKQMQELSANYDIAKKKGGRYAITYITSAEQQRRKGIAAGWIVTIEGTEVNLRSPNCYQSTGIDQYILSCALTATTATKTGFILLCFHQCDYFQKILCSDYTGAGSLHDLREAYTISALAAADEIISSRLVGKIDYLLTDYEKKGYINVKQDCLLNDGSHATVGEIQPYVEQALMNLNLESEFHACHVRATREKFFRERNRLYQEATGTDLCIRRKELHITPLIKPSHKQYPHIGPQTQEEILRKFFEVLRAKLLYDLRTKNKYARLLPSGKDRNGIHKKTVAEQTAEIISEYCVYFPDAAVFDPKRYDYYAVGNLADPSTAAPAEITGANS